MKNPICYQEFLTWKITYFKSFLSVFKWVYFHKLLCKHSQATWNAFSPSFYTPIELPLAYITPHTDSVFSLLLNIEIWPRPQACWEESWIMVSSEWPRLVKAGRLLGLPLRSSSMSGSELASWLMLSRWRGPTHGPGE